MTTDKTLAGAEIVLKEIEEKTRQRFLPIIGPVKGKYLAETVRKYRVEKVLEVGTLIGYSAVLIANNLPAGGHVYTIEINPQSAGQAVDNIRRAGLSGKVTVYTGNALEIIPTINEEFDMVFLDAGKTEYYEYLKLSEPRLKKNGIVFADNVKVFANQMGNFLSYIRDSGKYRSEYIDVGFDGVEIGIKLF